MTAAPKTAKGPFRYKMKQLVEATGLPRQAIHFYIQEGLLPPGKKTGRNMAWYSDEHLSRLAIIKKLQHERFLPLKAIKAVLDGREGAFTDEQRAFLGEVRLRLDERGTTKRAPEKLVDADALVARLGLGEDELDRAIELGLVGAFEDERGHRNIHESDAWVFELFADIRKLGFTREMGFTVDEVAFYEEFMQNLVDAEIRLLSSRLSHLPAEHVATMIERVLPIIHTMLVRYHESKVRDFFGTLL